MGLGLKKLDPTCHWATSAIPTQRRSCVTGRQGKLLWKRFTGGIACMQQMSHQTLVTLGAGKRCAFQSCSAPHMLSLRYPGLVGFLSSLRYCITCHLACATRGTPLRRLRNAVCTLANLIDNRVVKYAILQIRYETAQIESLWVLLSPWTLFRRRSPYHCAHGLYERLCHSDRFSRVVLVEGNAVE